MLVRSIGFRASVPALGEGQCFLWLAVVVVVVATEGMLNIAELVRTELDVGSNNDDDEDDVSDTGMFDGKPPFGSGDGDIACRPGERGSLPTSVAEDRRF